MEVTNWIMLSLPARSHSQEVYDYFMCQTNVQESDKKACISSFFTEHKNIVYVFLESYGEIKCNKK